ncbi:alpha/beta fold hydrolase [Rheinheimera sp.]|uniref:alpha/beta fold hydrolase n=1 Tax=Rheinheimera sp. TaxID=1869214 RepID=UPI00307CE2D9
MPWLLNAHFSEQNLLQRQPELLQFWQQGNHQQFAAQDGVMLACSQFIQPAARADLLICPGRIEAAEKYMESCFDLYQAGFNLHLLDHRGQGRSMRLCADSQLGYVSHFTDYVQDLRLFIDSKVRPVAQGPLLALGHSMGSAILCRYLQSTAAHGISAVVFCSPMFGLVTKPLPEPLALTLARLIRWWQQTPDYFPGQQQYRIIPFNENHLCQSQGRYQWFRELYEQDPPLKLGGVSSHWLVQALLACRQIQQAPPLDIPALLLQAGADDVVDNRAQLRFASAQPTLRLHRIDHARHELFLETDAIRLQLYQQLQLFWQQLGI